MWILLYLTFSLISPFEASPLTTSQPIHGNDSSSKVKPMNDQSKQAVPMGSTPILEQKTKTSSIIAAGLKKIETTKIVDMDKGAVISTGINTVLKNPQKSNHDPHNILHSQKSFEHPKEGPKKHSSRGLSVKNETTKISTENKRQMKQPRGINNLSLKEVRLMNVQNKNAVMNEEAIISTGINTVVKNQQEKKQHTQKTSHSEKSFEHHKKEPENYNTSDLSVKSENISSKNSIENKNRTKTMKKRDVHAFLSNVMNVQSKHAVPIGFTPILEQKNKTSSITAAGLKKIETTKNEDMNKGAIISNGINTVMKNQQEKKKQHTQKLSHSEKSFKHHKKEPGNYNTSDLSVKSENISSKISAENKKQIKTMQKRDVHAFLSNVMNDQSKQAVPMGSTPILEQKNKTSSITAAGLKKIETTKNADMDKGAIISTGINTVLKNPQNSNHDPHNTLQSQKSFEHPKEDPKQHNSRELSVKSETTKISTENKKQMKQPRRINDFPIKEVRPKNVRNKNSVIDKKVIISTGTNTVMKNQHEKEKQHTQKTSHSEKSFEHHKKEPGNYNTSDLSVKSENISSKISVENKNQIKTMQKRDVHAFLSNVISNQNMHGVSMDSIHIHQRQNETLSTVSEESMKKEKFEENTDMNIETKISNGTNRELKKKQKKDKRDSQKTSHNHKYLEHHQESANLSNSELPVKSEITTSKINTENENAAIQTENHQTNTGNNAISNLNGTTVAINEQHPTKKTKTIQINLVNNDHHNLVPVKSEATTSKISTENKNAAIQTENHHTENNVTSNLNGTTVGLNEQHQESPANNTKTTKIIIWNNDLQNLVPDQESTFTDLPNSNFTSRSGNQSIVHYSNEDKDERERMPTDRTTGAESTKVSKKETTSTLSVLTSKAEQSVNDKIYVNEDLAKNKISQVDYSEATSIKSSDKMKPTVSSMSTQKPTKVSKKESTSTLSVLTSKAEQSVNDKIYVNEDVAKNKISQVGYPEATSIKSSDKMKPTKKPSVSRKNTAEALDLKPPFVPIII